ncbi:hypothetical protein Syun_017115 [Stephania yunnanensis]|uniref:Uncharacterized protein n=1 Tax=Stephania yunnanensis TaxID=152371 RepID=A0AAP0P2S1_9MAGN
MKNYLERGTTGKSDWMDDEGDWLAIGAFPFATLKYPIVAFLFQFAATLLLDTPHKSHIG